MNAPSFFTILMKLITILSLFLSLILANDLPPIKIHKIRTDDKNSINSVATAAAANPVYYHGGPVLTGSIPVYSTIHFNRSRYFLWKLDYGSSLLFK